ncbi:putative transcriptional regulator, MerR family [Nocardia nova SH22a]|uniref:Putative transcriptional regulator, MerR family n=1 Tax=Nocardia nova SH22a TaxID=1415166 RepID=W5TED7_9NOCA|nr:MerR family transcriptional regulator [Nocardia nova]AHH15606.1 putative transcriptional regulator, MerR family [Nocardia nova SH22a]
MRIGELARRSGATTRALRYYEEQGLLASERTGNGYRDYSEASLLRVRQIRALLDAGFNSQTVAQLLPCANGSRPQLELCPDIVAAMQTTLRRIESNLETLGNHHAAVSSFLEDRSSSDSA